MSYLSLAARLIAAAVRAFAAFAAVACLIAAAAASGDHAHVMIGGLR